MLAQFKTFQADRMDLDELVALAAYGAMLRAEYEKHNLDEPEFVDVQLKSLRREITTRDAERLEARRKELNSRLESLKTPNQKKQDLLAERKRIDAKLAEIGA